MESYCQYSKYVKEGLDQYLTCSKSHTYCKYQRLCKTRKMVVHTDGYKECPILIAEEEKNMARKSSSSKKKEQVVKPEIISEDAIKDENSAKAVSKKEQAIVILADANFYIVRKGNSNCKIVEKNNYKKGDIVEL